MAFETIVKPILIGILDFKIPQKNGAKLGCIKNVKEATQNPVKLETRFFI